MTTVVETAAWRPEVYDGADPGCLRHLEMLRRRATCRVHDTLRAQAAELIVARRPKHRLAGRELDEAVGSFLSSADGAGTWVYYPWSDTLVRVLNREDFRELRSNRNQLRIFPEEQATLRQATVAVAGLSVGLAVATTLALEGVGGHFHLADFDELGLSNLNRLLASVAELGLNKAVLAARRLYELDPFLDVTVFSDGVADTNLDEFLGEGAEAVDLLVEECDDLYMKVRLREVARARRIPVIMHTSDGGLLDVERFDREPDRPLLHGRVPNLDAENLRGLETRDKVPIVLQILGTEHFSDRTAASLIEIRQTLHTWPQLASSVVLGGAVVTDVARRVLLGSFNDSGRFFVDTAALIPDSSLAQPACVASVLKAKAEAQDAPVAPDASADKATSTPRHDSANTRVGTGRKDETNTASGSASSNMAAERGPLPAAALIASASSSTPTLAELEWIAVHGHLAPSGGNVQPWRFRLGPGVIDVVLDTTRSTSFMNFAHAGSFVAIGAALENMLMAAASLGFHAEVEIAAVTDHSACVCRLVLGLRRDAHIDPLLALVPARVTNRQPGARRPLCVAHRAQLERAALPSEVRWFDAAPDIQRLAVLQGRADRLRFLSKHMHGELMAELRWTPAEAARTGDGLDIRSLEMPASDLAALQLLSRWSTLSITRQIDGGHAIADLTRQRLSASSALVILQTRGAVPDAYIEGGRQLQRLWLTATQESIAVHPQGALVYLVKRFEQCPGTIEEGQRDELADICRAYRELVPANGCHDVVMLRLSHAPPPSVTSLRRPLHMVVDA